MRQRGVAEQRGGQDEPVGMRERREAELLPNPSKRQGDAGGANGNRRCDKGCTGAALYERYFCCADDVDDQRLSKSDSTNQPVWKSEGFAHALKTVSMTKKVT